jgi:hypothetical protein
METTMANYRGVTITQTSIKTGGSDGRPLRSLYELSGAIDKPAGQRPFLTSRQACRDWISDILDSAHITMEMIEEREAELQANIPSGLRHRVEG